MSPKAMRSMDTLLPFIGSGGVWALDNFCFKNYNPENILFMLKRYQGLKGCLFAVAPDVVQDHDSTLLLFRAWVGTYQALGYPIAFVLQNGVTLDTVPWDSIDAIFIGGDDTFKFLPNTIAIALEAKRRGKWVHFGRVNTEDRINRLFRKYWHTDYGCLVDSFDGTCYSMFLDTYVSKHLRFYADNYVEPNQLTLWR